jgi:aryl-alcohol dehydrogenase-like predicted oxidoreductase
LVREAIELGVRFFDTADSYGSGRSEVILGRALGRARDDVVLATKGGYVFHELRTGRMPASVAVPVVAAMRRLLPGRYSPYLAQDFSPAYLRSAVDASLRRLNTDHIDFYQLHAPRELCAPPTIAALDDLVRVGKIGRIGIGFESIESAGAWLDIDSVTGMQVPFGILDPQAGSLIPAAAAKGVHLIARGVLASGLLDADESTIGVHLGRRKFDLLEQLRRIATDTDMTMPELALRWVLAQPLVSTVLVGINTSRHLRAVVEAAEAPAPEPTTMMRVDRLIGSYLAWNPET